MWLILIIVGIALLAVGYFCLKDWNVKNQRIGVKFTIIGFICLGIGILGYVAVPMIDIIRRFLSKLI